MNGKLLLFEGIDGCGKSTQARMALDYIRSKDIKASLFREPGGTPQGEAIRRILLSREDYRGGLGKEAEYLLFASARAELTRLIIRPLLDQGITVLLDRFGLSSIAYQGYGHGLNIEFIKSVNALVTNNLSPDQVFLFDLDPSLALSRVKGEADRIEKNGLDFFVRVRQGYLAEANQKPEDYLIIDASKSIEAIFEEIKVGIEKTYSTA